MTELKPQLRMLAIGPQRTASSWLDRALRTNPHLQLPAHVKETFFFDRYYDRGIDWYLSLFGGKDSESVCAEVGPTYFESLAARHRILDNFPAIKILITIRNPIARSFSLFCHECAKGRAEYNFFEAVQKHPRILDSGRYGHLAPLWESDFGRDQVFYIMQEDIEADPQTQLDVICSIIGINATPLPDGFSDRFGQGTVPRYPWLAAAGARSASLLRGAGLHRVVEAGKLLGLKRIYSGGDPSKLAMPNPVFEYLATEHESDIGFLEERLNRSFAHWRDPRNYSLAE